MARHCKGCARARERVGWDSCKGRPLCREIDLTFAQRNPHLSVADRRAAKVLLTRGHNAAFQHMHGQRFPAAQDDFVELVCALHRLIFESAEPDRAGRFRTNEIEFGGPGQHRLVGVRPSQIRGSLTRVRWMPDPPYPDVSCEELARWAARFLEQFYRVHPFHDGNGRVGRLFVELAAMRSSNLVLLPWPQTSKQKRRYLHALEYAHKHAAGSEHPESYEGRKDPYWPLAHRIQKLLMEFPSDQFLEAEPPSWLPDDDSEL